MHVHYCLFIFFLSVFLVVFISVFKYVFLVVFISVFKSVFLSFVSFTSMCVFFCSLNALIHFNLYSFFFSLSISHFLLSTFTLHFTYFPSVHVLFNLNYHYLFNNCLLFSFFFYLNLLSYVFLFFLSMLLLFLFVCVSYMFLFFLSFFASHILCLDYG